MDRIQPALNLFGTGKNMQFVWISVNHSLLPLMIIYVLTANFSESVPLTTNVLVLSIIFVWRFNCGHCVDHIASLEKNAYWQINSNIYRL